MNIKKFYTLTELDYIIELEKSQRFILEQLSKIERLSKKLKNENEDIRSIIAYIIDHTKDDIPTKLAMYHCNICDGDEKIYVTNIE